MNYSSPPVISLDGSFITSSLHLENQFQNLIAKTIQHSTLYELQPKTPSILLDRPCNTPVHNPLCNHV